MDRRIFETYVEKELAPTLTKGDGELVLAFVRREEIADAPDLLPEGIDGPDSLGAEMGFRLCEGHFDRIEVGTVGRQEQDPGTSGLDGLLGGLALVGRQIVQNDDAAGYGFS